MSYNQAELTAVLDSIIEIGSSSDELKPFMDEYYVFFQKVSALRDRFYSFIDIMKDNPDLVQEISTQFTDLEKSVMDNAKEILIVCYDKKDSEGFHPNKDHMEKIFKTCMMVRDRITSFEVLLTAFMPTGR